ncbi:uncharacterized protein LOC135822883 [Sycon ciliatum]|uniref:uncharacterized protein LOC135822883 n=1 Tax=Sycon ciliatum TaxID=27933 RepID=UPI0031F6DAB4
MEAADESNPMRARHQPRSCAGPSLSFVQARSTGEASGVDEVDDLLLEPTTTAVQEAAATPGFDSGHMCLSFSKSSSSSLLSNWGSSSRSSFHRDVLDWEKPMAMVTLDHIMNHFIEAVRLQPELIESRAIFRCIACSLGCSNPDAERFATESSSLPDALDHCLMAWRRNVQHQDPSSLEEMLSKAIEKTYRDNLFRVYTGVRRQIMERSP